MSHGRRTLSEFGDWQWRGGQASELAMRLRDGIRLGLGSALCLAPFFLVAAQRPASSRKNTFTISAVRIDLLRHPSVARELRLSPDQLQKAKTLLAEHDQEFWVQMRDAGLDLAGFQCLRSGEKLILFDELEKRVADIGGKTDDKFLSPLSAPLDAAQRQRLHEIALQAAGDQALLDPAISKAVGLG